MAMQVPRGPGGGRHAGSPTLLHHPLIHTLPPCRQGAPSLMPRGLSGAQAHGVTRSTSNKAAAISIIAVRHAEHRPGICVDKQDIVPIPPDTLARGTAP